MALLQVDRPAQLLNTKSISVVSLFSGCGGMDLGFQGGFEFLGKYYERLPFVIKWANEINRHACQTYRKNLGNHLVEGDIWSLMEQVPSNVDVVIGGFPCQDVSINGKGAGVNGRRTSLYLAMVEVVRRTQPQVFVAENVRGLLTNRHKSDLEKILSDFASLGYDLDCSLYRAHEYEVPQTRERVFIVGTRKGDRKFAPPAITCFESEYITCQAALEDLKHVPYNGVNMHIWSNAQASTEQGNRRLKGNRPGYTIRAECHGNIQFHYDLPRRISMREAARLQSFPDSFEFISKLRETERQIGNAVPPVLAWHVAKQVASLFDKPQ